MFSHGRTPRRSEESYKDDQLGEVGLDQRAAAAVFVGDEVMRQILLSPSIGEKGVGLFWVVRGRNPQWSGKCNIAVENRFFFHGLVEKVGIKNNIFYLVLFLRIREARVAVVAKISPFRRRD